MIGATLTARSRQGGAALSRPFDGTNLDLTTGPAPGVSLATFTQTTTNAAFAVGSSKSAQSYYVGTNNLAGQLIRYATTNPSGTPGQAFQVALFPNGGAITDCDSDIALYNNDTNTAAPGQIVRNRVATDINAQRGTGDSAAIDAGGLIKDCDVTGTSIDGIWPGFNTGLITPGPWTVVEGCRAIGATFNYYGGQLYGGSYPYNPTAHPTDAPGGATAVSPLSPTKANILAATPWPTGGAIAVSNGQLITATLGTLGSGLYQVVTAGTLGTENPSGNWPDTSGAKWESLLTGDVTQPFTSGTAKLVFIGGAFHSDAGQTTDRQRFVHRRGMAADFAGSCFLCQNASGNSNPLPVMNVGWEDYIFRGGGTYDLYCQTQTGDTTSAWTYTGVSGGNKEGGYVRNSDASWSPNPDVGNSRPWHAFYRRNTHLAPISPLSPRLGHIPTWNTAITANGALFVSSSAIKDAGIAAQFGWNLTDTSTQLALSQMRLGTYDYTTLPEPVSAVFELRIQLLNVAFGPPATAIAAISVCCANADAFCWVEWELILGGSQFVGGVLQNAALLTPHAAANSENVPANKSATYLGTSYPITDAQGYYIGP